MVNRFVRDLAIKLISNHPKRVSGLVSRLNNELLLGVVSHYVDVTMTDKRREGTPEYDYIKTAGECLVNLGRDALTRFSPEARDRFIEFLVYSFLGYFKRQKTRAEGKAAPFAIAISPTERCNKNCYGCYAAKQSKKNELSFDEVNRIVGEGLEMGTYSYVFVGGEPFMWEPVYRLFEEQPKAFFHIFTNGTLLDVDRLPVNTMTLFSLEGGEQRTDERRGEGTFKTVMEKMQGLNEKGVSYGASVTVTSENFREALDDKFVDDLLFNRGAHTIWYFLYIPEGREPNLDLMPTPEQRFFVRNRVREIRERTKKLVVSFWDDGETLSGCIAGGHRYLHINSLGDVEPCVFLHYTDDNIKGKTLQEVLNSRFLKGMRANQPFGENKGNPCPIIDHNDILRRIVQETGAHPTYKGAESLTCDFGCFFDAYSRRYTELLNS